MKFAGKHRVPARFFSLALAAAATILASPETPAKETVGYEIAPAPAAARSENSSGLRHARSGPSAPSPLSLNDLERLIEESVPSGVIVRQIRRSGIAFEPGVEEILHLNQIGATDEVLGALQDAADGSDPAVEPPPARSRRTPADVIRSLDPDSPESLEDEVGNYRIIRRKDDRGRRSVVLTNLDEDGRRIGGEVPYPKPPNVISPAVRPSGFTPAAPRPADPDQEPWRRESRRSRRGDEQRGRWTGDAPHGGSREDRGERNDDRPTVIVIQPPQPEPQPRPVYVPGYAPYGFHSTGGIVGPFRYPDKLWFLGYTPDGGPVRSPAPAAGPNAAPRVRMAR